MAQFALKAVISADDRLSGPLRRIQSRLTPLGGAFSRVGGAVRSLASDVAKVGLIGVGAVVGVAALTKNFVESTAELGHFLKQVEFAPKAFQELQFAAGQAGIGTEDFRNGIAKLSQNVGKYKAGSGALAELMNKHASPAFRNQLKHVVGNADAFDLASKAIFRETDVQKKAALAVAFFGKSGQGMLKMFAEGPGVLAANRKAAAVLGDATIGAAVKTKASMERLGNTFAGVKGAIADKLLPVLTPLIEQFTIFLTKNRDLIALKAGEAFTAIADSVKKIDMKAVVGDIKDVARFARDAVKSVGGVKNALKILVLIRLAPLIAGVYSLAAAFTAALIPATGLEAVMLSSGMTVAILATAAAVLVIAKNWERVAIRLQKVIDLVDKLGTISLFPGGASFKLIGIAARKIEALRRAPLPLNAAERASGLPSPFAKGPLAITPFGPPIKFGQPVPSMFEQGGGRHTVGGKIDITVSGPAGTRVRTKADPGTEFNTYTGLNLRGAGSGM
jgi:hypothetical protein